MLSWCHIIIPSSARKIKQSCRPIKTGLEGNKVCFWDPFPWINLLASHPFHIQMSMFWTYISVPLANLFSYQHF